MAVSNDEKMFKERIRHLLTFKRETVADWADNETLRVRYRRQVNGEASVPYSTIVLILERYHDISADWLVMGEDKCARLITLRRISITTSAPRFTTMQPILTTSVHPPSRTRCKLFWKRRTNESPNSKKTKSSCKACWLSSPLRLNHTHQSQRNDRQRSRAPQPVSLYFLL